MTIHEKMHSVGDAPNSSESYYFNFYDPNSQVGMFTRMGWRPGNGWADALHVLYLPGSRVLFTYGRREISGELSQYDGDLSVGNLTITCAEPHQRWLLDYSGEAQDIADGAVLLQRSKQRPDGWFKSAQLDMSLRFDCLSEPHFLNKDGSGHFEQTGRVSGTVKLEGEEWPVDGYGVRDKSWGVRDWSMGKNIGRSNESAPSPHVHWFSANFGPDLAIGGSALLQDDGSWLTVGSWLLREGKKIELSELTVETVYKPGSILQKSVVLTAKSVEGEDIVLNGEIINMCPTKVPAPGGAIFINEGLACYKWGDKTGYGISEQWHTVSL